jgi:hypothetical protein
LKLKNHISPSFSRRSIAQDNDATFVPFAIETYGGLGDGANKFVNTLVAAAKKLQYTWVK